MIARSFSDRILTWFQRHGRRSLPWQRDLSPYRVWVSEIMLQQTQVATVLNYFQRFMARFPDVETLAAAELDEVLHLWSGLGYYARGRNLHRAAKIICAHHGGEFPAEVDTLRALPGIGRSTAGAILALAWGQRHPILDGNVKRVLCRFHALEGAPTQSSVERRLWELADYHTPSTRIAEYTQAIMDLGATVCTRSRPSCTHCPLQDECRAHAEGRETDFPTRRPRNRLPRRSTTFIMLRGPDGRVLLEKRPPTGVWGGLWSFPECPPKTNLVDWCVNRLGYTPTAMIRLPGIRHIFSHFQLDISPVLIEINDLRSAVMEGDHALWYNTALPETCGLAAPVSELLSKLAYYEKAK